MFVWLIIIDWLRTSGNTCAVTLLHHNIARCNFKIFSVVGITMNFFVSD